MHTNQEDLIMTVKLIMQQIGLEIVGVNRFGSAKVQGCVRVKMLRVLVGAEDLMLVH